MTKQYSFIGATLIMAILILGQQVTHVLSLPTLEHVTEAVTDALAEAGTDVSFIASFSSRKKSVLDFVNDQFNNWKHGSDCKAFANSFVEPFEYCDATKECITGTKDLEEDCNKVAALAGKFFELKVEWTYAQEKPHVFILKCSLS